MTKQVPVFNTMPGTSKLIMDYEVYSKVINWPRDIGSVSLDLTEQTKPIPIYTDFITLCYALKKEDVTLTVENRRKLQKIFAYLLEHVEDTTETEREKQRMFLCLNLLSLYPDLINTKVPPIPEAHEQEAHEQEDGNLLATVTDEGVEHIEDDMQFILKHLSQNNRAWIKTCLIQALKIRQQELLESKTLKNKGGAHDTVLDVACVGSEVANIGIVLQEVVGGVFFGQHWIEIGIEVSRYSNPIIYAFKVAQRGLKFIGRKFLGLEFAEDEVGINPWQNFADVVSASIFLTVMVLLIVNTPILNSVAWLLAPIGLGIVWKSEYGYQNERAADRLKNMKACGELFDHAAQVEAARIAKHKKIASYALFGVILGLTIGMLAVHASSIPGLNLIFNEHTLGTITTISGIILGGLAAIRAGNFFWERKGPAIKETFKEFIQDPMGVTKEFVKTIGHFIVEAVKSTPDKIKAVFLYLIGLPEKAINYWKGLDGWQKVALGFTLASLALSISVFTGGIPVTAGLITAGLCSLVSTIIKFAPKIIEACNKRIDGVEVVEPYSTPLKCNNAITEIRTQHEIEIKNSFGVLSNAR